MLRHHIHNFIQSSDAQGAVVRHGQAVFTSLCDPRHGHVTSPLSCHRVAIVACEPPTKIPAGKIPRESHAAMAPSST